MDGTKRMVKNAQRKGARIHGRNLGRGLSIWATFCRGAVEAHEQIDEEMAVACSPAVCHALVNRHMQRLERQVRRHIRAVTGLEFPVFRQEVLRRTTPRVALAHGL
jgi:hypothetical protein